MKEELACTAGIIRRVAMDARDVQEKDVGNISGTTEEVVLVAWELARSAACQVGAQEDEEEMEMGGTEGLKYGVTPLADA
jgi:hypothetical protein